MTYRSSAGAKKRTCVICPAKHLAQGLCRSHYRRSRLYGLDTDQFIELLNRHGGTCPICTTRWRDMVIDHCHQTGHVRDLICRTCNTEVGWIERGLAMRCPPSQRVVDYIERWADTLSRGAA
jgi:hypothetical protein